MRVERLREEFEVTLEALTALTEELVVDEELETARREVEGGDERMNGGELRKE